MTCCIWLKCIIRRLMQIEMGVGKLVIIFVICLSIGKVLKIGCKIDLAKGLKRLLTLYLTIIKLLKEKVLNIVLWY